MSTLTIPDWPKQSALESFYGKIQIGADGLPTERWQASALTTLNLPYGMRPAWNHEGYVRRVLFHRMAVKSLASCLSKILAHYRTPEAVRKAGMDLFGGTYGFGLRADGRGLSAHTYGIAIDLDPEHNPPGKKHADGGRMIPQEVVDIFEQEGWTWGGRWRNPECAHFQAASI